MPKQRGALAQKIVAVLIVLLALVGVVSGCGGDERFSKPGQREEAQENI
jgi:hypothetical protein